MLRTFVRETFTEPTSTAATKQDLAALYGSQPIPQPPEHAWGFLGNIPDIDPEAISASYGKLVDLYGPIFKLNFLNKDLIIISNQELINEVSDESRFTKALGVLKEVRLAIGDGLITAYTDEHNWKLAHKLLMASFGPMAIRSMFPQMLDITSQLIQKLERMGPGYAFDAAEIFTRLSLDVIALTGFDYRFNSFYRDESHPFVSSLMGMLTEASQRSRRSKLGNTIRLWAWHNFQQNTKIMHRICDEIIEDRRKNPKDVNDFLNVMLNARDKETGEGLSEENIRFNVETLLAAGHETTSGLLSFTFWLLLKHPDKMQKAITEVDTVIGEDQIRIQHLPKLKYIDAVLKESMRVHPPAAQVAMQPKSGRGVIGGIYPYSSSDIFILNLIGLHRDPTVWGDDAAAFRPERMLDGGFESLPPNSWRPFGGGLRACIGRDFAMQEALTAMALILQRYQVELADPFYELKISQTVTQKPDGLLLKVKARTGRQAESVGASRVSASSAPLRQMEAMAPQAVPSFQLISHLTPITILYGSNSGTCKLFAEDIRAAAPSFGFGAEQIETLDSATEKLPYDRRPVIIITSSYEGRPTDDAKKFVSWLEAAVGDTERLKGVRYTVLGLGNKDWVGTYQRTPKLIDSIMDHLGAFRFAPFGRVDVGGDVYGDVEEWSQGVWNALKGSGADQLELEPLEIETKISDRPHSMGEKGMTLGTILENREISSNEAGYAKKHIEIALPKGMTYSSGDYVTVLPTNNRTTIRRILNRFSLPTDASIILKNSKKSFLPNGRPEYAYSLLAHYVELNTPISRKQFATLVELAEDEAEKHEMERLAASAFEAEVLGTRTSVIDVLEAFPSCSPSFATYIDMLLPLKVRQYSISSSALAAKGGNIASITYDVLAAPSLTNGNRAFLGVASNYLSNLQPGDRIHCFVRVTNSNFHLPSDPTVPIIMIAAGTGIAPMRGLIQERAAIALAGGKAVGKAVFYFGCRHPKKDYLYRSDFVAWEKFGVVVMRPCFSRLPEESCGYKYVPERLWAEREELRDMFDAGAKIFLCGSAGKLAKSTGEICEKMYMESQGATLEQARKWLEKQKVDRYVTDIFD